MKIEDIINENETIVEADKKEKRKQNMEAFSNTNELNDMIDEFVYKYASIFQDVVKCAMRDDIQKLVDEAKKEVRESYQNYVADKDSDA